MSFAACDPSQFHRFDFRDEAFGVIVEERRDVLVPKHNSADKKRRKNLFFSEYFVSRQNCNGVRGNAAKSVGICAMVVEVW